MELKTKEAWRLRSLCALLLLTACCFRTAAVLWERGSAPPLPEYEHFLLTVGQPQGEPTDPGQTLQSPLLFLDSSYVDIYNGCDAVFDREALFREPLSLTLSRGPCVLIVHTHGSEAYRDCEDYRSLDPGKNMVSIGAHIADRLNAAGIPTVHDTTLHDVTAGYDLAYEQAAASIEAYLEQYPSIQIVIDIHRDASAGADGQKPLLTDLNGEQAAQLMLVMGTGSQELPNLRWEDNLSLAMKLQAYFSSLAPGIMRQTNLRSSRYNQHLAPYSLLMEVGSAGNTREEAISTASFIGDHLAQFLLAFQVADD